LFIEIDFPKVVFVDLSLVVARASDFFSTNGKISPLIHCISAISENEDENKDLKMNKTLITNFTPKLKYTRTWDKALQDEQNLGTNFIQKLNKYITTSTT
jgi:hypothetical protein